MENYHIEVVGRVQRLRGPNRIEELPVNRLAQLARLHFREVQPLAEFDADCSVRDR
jgi:hypothetical protein